MKTLSKRGLWILATIAALWAAGCGDEYPSSTGDVGGGGADVGPTQGGAAHTGGKSSGTGGRGGVANGGAAAHAGQAPGGAAGQAPVTNGGTEAQGGAAIGGALDPGGGTTGLVVGGSTGAQNGGTGGAVTQTTTAGTTGAGGTGCGTTPSTFSEQLTFATTAAQLQLLSDVVTGQTLKFATAVPSPAYNPSLCANDCAAFSAAFPATTSPGNMNVRVVQFFEPIKNLVGATFTATIAVDNPNAVPVTLKLFTGGDSATNWAWGKTTIVPTAALATTYAASSGFKDVSVAVGDQANFCASKAYYIAIWLDVSSAASIAVAGTVTVYIKKITVTPPGGIVGTGGAPGVGGTSGASGSVGTSGSAGRAGGSSTSVTSGGTAGAAGAAGATSSPVEVAGSAGFAGSTN